MLEQIIKEKISADHLYYVSLKYTKTCDVIINLLRRWRSLIEICLKAMLQHAKKRKKIKSIPVAPKQKTEKIKELFKKKPEVLEAVEIYEFFKQIDTSEKIKEHDFRKNVCLKVKYRGKEISINMDKLKGYEEIVEKFVNFVKTYLSS